MGAGASTDRRSLGAARGHQRILAHLETVIAPTALVPSRLTTLVVLEMPVIDQRSHSLAERCPSETAGLRGCPVRSAEAVHKVARVDAEHLGELEDVV